MKEAEMKQTTPVNERLYLESSEEVILTMRDNIKTLRLELEQLTS